MLYYVGPVTILCNKDKTSGCNLAGASERIRDDKFLRYVMQTISAKLLEGGASIFIGKREYYYSGA